MAVLAAVVGAIGVNIAMARGMNPSSLPSEADKKREADMITTFAEFFMMRLDDESTLVESLQGLWACVISGRLSRSLCELILKKVFCDVSLHLQSSPNKTRRGAYWLLSAMLEDEVGGGNAAVKHLGEEIVGGFVNAMDGEKEPRNLQIALLLLPRLVWAVPQHVALQEDLFEISSCYFPVTFTERADDPNAIRKSSLVNALRNTMCGGTEFWIPFLLEKLASTLVETKLETLHSFHHALTSRVSLATPGGYHPPLAPSVLFLQPISSSVIETCFSPFGVLATGTIFWRFDQVQPHLVSITQALIKEIISTTDEQVAQSACSILTDLAKFIQLSANGSPDNLPSSAEREKALQDICDIIFKLSLHHLGLAESKTGIAASPDSKLAAMASKIICSVTCGSKEAANFIFKRVLPALESKWLSAPADRSFVVRQLLNLTKASSVFTTTSSPSNMQVDGKEASTSLVSIDHPIAAYADTISRIMLSCCQETAAFAQDQADAMETLGVVATAANGTLVTPATLAQIVAAINHKLIESSKSTSTSVASVGIKLGALKALLKIHSVHEEAILEGSHLAPIWNELQSRIDAIANEPTEANYNDYSALVASLHVFCDPSSLPAQDESEAPEIFVDSPKITARIQSEITEVLKKRSNDPRIFSILLSSLSRTATSLNQFKLAFSYVAKNADSEDENWAKAAQKWLPLLSQRIASHALSTGLERLNFFRDMFDAFVDRSIASLLLPNILEPALIDSQTLDRIVALCVSSLYSVSIALPLRDLVESVEGKDLVTSRLYALLQRILSDISTSTQKTSCNNCSTSAQGCGSSSPQLAVERSMESWAVEAFGSILNKLPPSGHMDSFLKEFWFENLFPTLRDLEQPTFCTIYQVQLCIISAKALAQTKHSTGNVMVEHLITLLKEAKSMDVRRLVSQEIGTLLRDYSAAMPFHAILYKQRVWGYFRPILDTEYMSATPEQQAIYMQMTSSLLKYLPSSVMVQCTSYLIPMLLATLSRVGEPACDEAVLSLFSMLHTNEKAVLAALVDHIPSVIPNLVQITASASVKRPQPGSSPLSSNGALRSASGAARLAAADCLKILLKLPFVKINPMRNTVVNGLHPALDDPKRNVRRSVVATRNEWYLVNPSKQ